MGAYLAQLSSVVDVSHNPCEGLKKMNIARVQKIHSAFKNLCESFTINFTEYSQLLGETEASFAVWDSDANGLIDALELFTGLALYADARLEDRLRFIFELFDFNDIGSISIDDLEYMVDCCVGSSCKINGVSPRALDSEKVAEQVAAMAPAEGRITFAAALKWCATDKATTQLFTFIDNPEQKC